MATDYDLTATGNVDIYIDTFGTTPRLLERMPAPAEIPLPFTAVLLAGGLGLLGGLKSRFR